MEGLIFKTFLLIFINLQLNIRGCVLIYCRTLSSSILSDTRVTAIGHFLLEKNTTVRVGSYNHRLSFLFIFTNVKPFPLVLEYFWLPTIYDRSTDNMIRVQSYERDNRRRDMGYRSLRGRCHIPGLY